MLDILIEGLKVAGALSVLLVAAGVVWALTLGLWRAVTGEARRQRDAVDAAWIEGWNAAQRGAIDDADEWVRRMSEGLDK
jgi:hypothetical protein